MAQHGLENFVHAFVFSRLDYPNGVFAGLSKKIIKTTATNSEHSCMCPYKDQ